MIEFGDAAEPSGTIATRLTDGETAALLALYGERLPEAEEHDAILGAARKLWALLGDDVAELEIRAVRR